MPFKPSLRGFYFISNNSFVCSNKKKYNLLFKLPNVNEVQKLNAIEAGTVRRTVQLDKLLATPIDGELIVSRLACLSVATLSSVNY